jgi:hypothetical protein
VAQAFDLAGRVAHLWRCLPAPFPQRVPHPCGFCKGGRRCCLRYVMCCGGAIKPTRCMHSRLPPLQSTQERGTHRVADVGEIKSLGHPPSDPGAERGGCLYARVFGLGSGHQFRQSESHAGVGCDRSGARATAGDPLAGGPPYGDFSRDHSTEGAPSLRFLQGWAAMMPVLFDWLRLTARRPIAPASPTPALRKVREGRGTPLCG